MASRLFILCSLLLLSGSLLATHNRAGEITYRHLFGNTYEFTVKTCTKLTAEADRPDLVINYGDGTLDTIPRIQAIPFAVTDTKENTYIGTHTFSGPGTFIISVEDPNRNMGVINIANSVEKIFCIQTELIISPFLGQPNNSLQFANCPCPEIACLNQPWVYNLSAFDIDGDSLSYGLIPCKGEDCLDFAIPQVYQYPQDIGGGTISIHPSSGTIIWDSPGIIGEYNLAILVTEWRDGFKVGSVILDMQLTVAPCSNTAPQFDALADTCVFAGEILTQSVAASDVNTSQMLTMSANGEPFLLSSSLPTFTSVPSQENVLGLFEWQPDCNDIRNSPYSVVFEVNDNASDVSLRDVLVWDIIVNAPPVQGVTADPVGNTIQINWTLYFCENVDFYRVYRKSDSTTFDESCCDITNMLQSGYELIEETTDTMFIDNSELAIGNRYCYVVTAVLENGTESCPSAIDCAQLEFSVPILTNVTIFETNDVVGKDSVRWTHPQELNVIQFPGPYQYRLYRGIGTQFPNELVFQTTAESNLLECDTFFVDENLNTVLNEYRYRIELWSGGNVVGSGASSSSVYLSLVSNDNQLELFWTTNTSWYVDSTEIFRETSSGTGVYNSIGWSYSNYFLDTPLVNLQAYCYKVKTYGHYSLPTVDSPLINWSQEVCGEPFDYTPPCAPVLTVEIDCSVAENVLSWTNPNNSCADDVTRYAIYFAAQENEELEFLMLIDGDTDTTFRHFLPLGTPGCYYVTAIDSIPYNNESEPSNVVCVEHCDPLYILPNVITANNDGINDVFHPQLPFKFVERVEFKLFNRWGQLLFQTEDPMINWDGTIQDNGKKVVEGVYFYACRVYFLTLSGEDFIDLHGFVTVFN